MKTLLTIVGILLIGSAAFAQGQPAAEPTPEPEPDLAGVINQMRLKQQSEEQSVYRVIQTPVTHKQVLSCSEIQMARQRLRDIGNKNGENHRQYENVEVNMGNDNMTIEGNRGTVNNNINMQMVEGNEGRCL